MPLWPDGFPRVPPEDWVRLPIEDLALKYDSVEQHGWYENLRLTEEQLDDFLGNGSILIDYSGGTGILADRLLRRVGPRRIGILIVDSSPKFLRLALEKLGRDERVAFRLIRFLKEKKRLQLIKEVVEPPLLARGADAVASTNAIHLYYDLEQTLRSWADTLRPGGRAFIQSGNIRNPEAAPEELIIDETVESIHAAALDLARTEPSFAAFRAGLDDPVRMEQYDALRRKYFLPVRPLEYYLGALRAAGLKILEVAKRGIEARVSEWYEFLAAYHEGILGWAGGVEKFEGTSPPADVVASRLDLLRQAMDGVFQGRQTFMACWTYVTAAR
jgi:SAM-dependent methyltransferase